MSSGYKIKGHQRSRSAKPYERKSVSTHKVSTQKAKDFSMCVSVNFVM